MYIVHILLIVFALVLIKPVLFGRSRGWGFCLDDRPSKKELATPLANLGVRYTTHHQCQLQYGPNATFCSEVDVSVMHICSELKKKTHLVVFFSLCFSRMFVRFFGVL